MTITTDPTSRGQIQEFLRDKTAHVERAKDRNALRAYCMKEATREAGPFEFGTWPEKKGQRTDLIEWADKIAKADDFVELAMQTPHMFLKFGAKGRELWAMHQAKKVYDPQKDFRKVSVRLYVGGAGTDKTRSAMEWFAEKKIAAYKLDANKARGPANVWWDGYHGQAGLIIDDFDGWIAYKALLGILDGYPIDGQVKGGFSALKFTEVIITSDKWPEWWYPTAFDQQLARRIDEVLVFEGGGEGRRLLKEAAEDLTAWETCLMSRGGGGNTETPPPLTRQEISKIEEIMAKATKVLNKMEEDP